MRSHFNFNVLIVLQDVFKCSPWGRLEMGQKHRVKIEIWSYRWSCEWQTVHYFLFYLNVIVYFFFFFGNFGICTIWQFLLLQRSLKRTQKTVHLWRYFVWLYSYVGYGTFLVTTGKHFWIMTASLCLSVGSPNYMKWFCSDGRVSRSHIRHSPVLWASCICWG